MDTCKTGFTVAPALRCGALFFAMIWPFSAQAVPSFARQTGMHCSACHTVFPQLTPFGREFKLGGYTLSGSEEDAKKIPVAAGVQASYTTIKKSGMDVQDDKLRIPQTASLYYAGKVAGNLGAFTQVTYDSEDDDISLSMVDIRYADRISVGNMPLILGATLNNMPTLQDVWNSTPVFMFPYEPTAVAPAPAAGLGLSMPFMMRVVGAGVYGYWNNLLYTELGGYRSRDGGGEMGEIQGTAPYWRIALQGQQDEHSWSLGSYGLSGKAKLDAMNPMAMMMGDTQRYRDRALDAQYQFIGDPHIFSLYATTIQRRTRYDDPAMMMAVTRDLDVQRFNLSYSYKRKYGVMLGSFAVAGDADAMLYPMGEVSGSANGSPDSRGVVAEINYLPESHKVHIKYALQYTAYSKFNGASTDYDGFGRDASDNNTVYLLANFMF